MQVTEHDTEVHGTRLHHATAGSGPAVLLVHGFPHTHRVWSEVVDDLARDHLVVAPDLRGTGGSARATDGYDAPSLAADLLGLLDDLGVGRAAVVAIDAGVVPAFALALEHPDRVERLVLMESTLGTLPGAEDFLAGGPPWWFGFHAVPGLAETVLEGHEREYVEFFLGIGTSHPVADDVREAFVVAYRGRESLRCAFEHYRAMAGNDTWLRQALAARRLTVPTLALGAQPVGDALARQLSPYADDLRSVQLDDCRHIVPLDRPDALLPVLRDFLAPTAE